MVNTFILEIKIITIYCLNVSIKSRFTFAKCYIIKVRYNYKEIFQITVYIVY